MDNTQQFVSDEERARAAKAAEKRLAEDVLADFKRRQEERRSIERGWQLNMNFLSGNQYCDVNAFGDLEDDRGGYFWQQHRVFNYIAPMIDTRCSKLSRIRPKLAVRAASGEEDDKRSARIASAILTATCEDNDLDGVISCATVWSETCGSAFYKVLWDHADGREIGKTVDGASVREGKVKIIALSPFEIYPYSLSEESVENQPSIIHARAVPVQDIYAAYGVRLDGRDIEDFALSPTSAAAHSCVGGMQSVKAVRHGYEVIIERYTRPNCDEPEGRLTIVAGGELLYDGPMPYIIGENGTRTYPFVRQNAISLAGGFFGVSVVDRLIPVQRAYNAVKNRKHEFLNRISMGTVAVEDGSVDTDSLLDEGLAPGKIIVYRQGGTPPQMLTLGSVPSEFTQEEEKLEEEFAKISGTNDLTQEGSSFTAVTSATGLQLLIEQDEARLNVSYEQIKSAVRKIGRFVLRLYKQFASSLRLMRYASTDDEQCVISFKNSDITSDDVILEADSEINLSPAQRRAVVYDMIDKGLFCDENGKMSVSVKNKLLETLGYKSFVGERDTQQLHRNRCSQENALLRKGGTAEVKDYDDHAVHIDCHTAYLLSEQLTKEQEERICAHLNEHKKYISEVKNNG